MPYNVRAMNQRMRRAVLRRYVLLIVLSVVFIVAILIFSYRTVNSYTRYMLDDQGISSVEDAKLVVFGSAVDDIEKVPRSVVKERLDSALQLYERSIAEHIIVSGYEDEVRMDYDEPDVMRRYLIGQGVDHDDITEDKQGDNSYQTCKNLSDLDLEGQVILVTQNTHMPRVLYLCRNMGVDAIGYEADLVRSRRWFALQTTREALGSVKAVLDVHVRYNIFND